MTFINLKKSIAFYREYAIIDLSNEREVIDMRKPNNEFLKRVIKERTVDTRKYRYYCNGDDKIMRVPIWCVNTTGLLDEDNHEFICYERDVR